MTIPTIRELQELAGASFMPYGPAEAGGVTVVETFGAYEAEYAAIRKGVGLGHQPQTVVVAARGDDHADFLHRMLTHDVRTLQPGQGRRMFLLGKAGRIQADMVALRREDETLLVLDRVDAGPFVAEMEKYLFSEDVRLEDRSNAMTVLSAHGPAAAALLTRVSATSVSELAPLGHTSARIAGHACVIYRLDMTGVPGLHVLAPAEGGDAVYAALAEALGGLAPVVEGGKKRDIVGRGIGWLAFNTARIEAQTPLYHIDFGPDSLPHETGILNQTVSFTKGCYLGQEIVTRMQNMGHPRRIVTALRMRDDRLPIAGSQVLESGGGTVVGAITSSTLSPIRGQNAIALATMKWGSHQTGTKVFVPAEGHQVEAEVRGLGEGEDGKG